MLDVLNFDLYKTKKTLSTWIILACVLCFTIASVSITYVSKKDGELSQMASDIGEQITTQNMKDMSVLDWCADAIIGDFLLLFIIVFAILFVGNDFTTGYIKNIYGCIQKKPIYEISKLMVITMFCAFIMIVAYISSIMFNLIFIKSDMVGDIGNFLKFSFLKLMLSVAFGAIVTCITMIAKKTTVAMIICMGYSFIFVNSLYTGINYFINKVLKIEDFSIQKYTIIGNTISLNQEVTGKQSGIIIVVSVIAILISILVSDFFFSKRDV